MTVARDGGKKLQWPKKLKLHRWQGVLAAAITAIAAIVVAVVTPHGGSSSDGGP